MNIIESQVFKGELYIKASDHHRAVAAAFEAGKAAAFAQAAHTIGIDTSDGMHTVTVFRMLPGQPSTLVATARLPDGAAAEREACAGKAGEFARKWWSIHCASNKHMETTRKAHDDFCALQAAIRARGQT